MDFEHILAYNTTFYSQTPKSKPRTSDSPRARQDYAGSVPRLSDEASAAGGPLAQVTSTSWLVLPKEPLPKLLGPDRERGKTNKLILGS
jgi:hypothetical protein